MSYCITCNDNGKFIAIGGVHIYYCNCEKGKQLIEKENGTRVNSHKTNG
jgi:hypothetical protein